MKNLDQAIIIWRFDDAPRKYQEFSKNGGDEDWIAFVPDNFKDEYIAWLDEGTSFGYCAVNEYKVKGGIIKIGCHA